MILIEAVFPELSSTMNVGLNVAPLKITKRLSSAVSVKSTGVLFPNLIFTVGLTVSFTLTFTGTILDGCSCDAAGTLGPASCVFGNVTFT